MRAWNFYGIDPQMDASTMGPEYTATTTTAWFKNYPVDIHLEYEGHIIAGKEHARVFLDKFSTCKKDQSEAASLFNADFCGNDNPEKEFCFQYTIPNIPRRECVPASPTSTPPQLASTP